MKWFSCEHRILKYCFMKPGQDYEAVKNVMLERGICPSIADFEAAIQSLRDNNWLELDSMTTTHQGKQEWERMYRAREKYIGDNSLREKIEKKEEHKLSKKDKDKLEQGEF